jgi:hypothetical protein
MQGMPDLPPDIEDRIAADFAATDRPSAFGIIESLSGAKETWRVCRCVLFLARGQLSLLAHNAEQARLDYRDVIYWAEYDEQDRLVRDFSKPFPSPPA